MNASGTPAAARPLVNLRGVFKSYRMGNLVTEVLKGVDLDLQTGEFAVIFGPSGCGKTTLLNILGALDAPTSGSVVVNGLELSRMSRSQLTEFRRGAIGFVFQSYNLIPTLTARENVEAALDLLPFSSRREMRARALDYLQRVGLGAMGNAFPAQLSGGEQQRVAIARALAKEPQLVLADEPTGNLDEAMGIRVIDLMRELNAATGATFAVVSHNPRIADRADRVVRLAHGKIEHVASGQGDPTTIRRGHQEGHRAPGAGVESPLHREGGARPTDTGSNEKTDH